MQQLIEFSTQHALLVTALLASLFAVLFNELRLKTQDVASLAPALAVRLINQGARVVDLRPAEGFAAGHIVDAKRMDEPALLAEAATVAGKKSLLLVCESGSVSGRCATRLRGKGMESVFNIKGGLNAWRQDSLPLVDGK